LAIDHLFQQFNVLVVHVHRTRALAINEDRVFLTGSGSDSRSLSGATASAHWARRHRILRKERRMVFTVDPTRLGRLAKQRTRNSKRWLERLTGPLAEYVGEESWWQGEAGPRFALSRLHNLCHIFWQVPRVGKVPFLSGCLDSGCVELCASRLESHQSAREPPIGPLLAQQDPHRRTSQTILSLPLPINRDFNP
jgi:hypothetical protein